MVIMKALEVDGISLPSFNPLIQGAKVFSRSFNQLLYSHAMRDGIKLAYCLSRYSLNVSDCIVYSQFAKTDPMTLMDWVGLQKFF